jgi:hypothetical protein
MIVDITIWNQDIVDYTGKDVLFSGFRLKTLTDETFVLVSTVYSKMMPI